MIIRFSIFLEAFVLGTAEEPQHSQDLQSGGKRKDRQEVDFFAKFVLCSNNEFFPVIIDQEETRYWVRKVQRLDNDDTSFLEKLKSQIPAFLYFLQRRTLSTKEESRMWFSPALLRTEALKRIMQSNRNHTEAELLEIISEIMELNILDKFSFIPQDLTPLLIYNNVKVELWQIRKVVKEIWKLTPAPNAYSYTTYQMDYNAKGHFSPINRVGRFYTVTHDFINKQLK